MNIRCATFNISFDHTGCNGEESFAVLQQRLLLTPVQQSQLLRSPATHHSREEQQTVRQIQNVAAIIQTVRPDILLLNEFNNDGTGENFSALDGFIQNYLNVSQSPELEGISYPFRQSFATNTGLSSGYDLNHNDSSSADELPDPQDSWGFGHYHGKYALALLSRYPIDSSKTRTLQTFRWQHMPRAKNPLTRHQRFSHRVKRGQHYPANGRPWFPWKAWRQMPVAAKTIADTPITIPTTNGQVTLHFIAAHPCPPIGTRGTQEAILNRLRNKVELQLIHDYLSNYSYIYDDQGTKGGLAEDARFILAGDLNNDPCYGDGDRSVMEKLLQHPRIHPEAATGKLTPRHRGEAREKLPKNHERLSDDSSLRHGNKSTHCQGLRLDYVLPDSRFKVSSSGIFWPDQNSPQHHLICDSNLGENKLISSDHRLVWLDISMNE